MTQYAMPDALLKRLVGHTMNTDTSGIYGHEVDGELLEAQRIVNGVIRNIKNDVKVTVKSKCIFRPHPDSDSGNIRTAFRNYPDSKTETSGQHYGTSGHLVKLVK